MPVCYSPHFVALQHTHNRQSNQNEVTVEKTQMKAIRNPRAVPCPPQKDISVFWGEMRVEGASL